MLANIVILLNPIHFWHFFVVMIVKIPSKHHESQTGRAWELKFLENVHPLEHVTCHMSHVACHVSHVTYPVSHVIYLFFSDKVVKLIV